MKTLAAVLTEVNKPLVIEELFLPDPGYGQVLVKIAYSGVCHSQLNEIHGLKGKDKFLPHTLGHEGSGIIERIGPGVKKVVAGDRVVLTWIKGIGADVPASVYADKNGRKINSGPISTFLTRAVISENRVVKISENMPLKEAALLGCAVPTGAGVVMKAVKSAGTDSIAIFGLGGIGLSALLAAKTIAIPKIIGIDVFDYKLEKAKQLGATDIVNAGKSDALSRIMEVTSGVGVDYAVECSGKRTAMEAAFKSVRDKGGLCIIAGNLPQGEEMSIDPFDLIKGKQVIGTWGGETQPDIDIPMYADWFLSGKLDLEKLICRDFHLKEIGEAIDYMEQHAVGRVLINMSDTEIHR